MADLESAGYYFFLAGKVSNGVFSSAARDNLEVQNVETTSKFPKKMHH